MARLPRLTVPGYPHHIIQRGNNRQPIFLDDEDRRFMLDLLADYASQFKVAVHAYVLMGNHMHLLATPESEDGLSRMMQSVGRRYVRHFNDRHHRSGTLWEGRYRSTVIEADAHLLTCMAYIDLNPVRAGLSAHARDYPWSSHAHYAGLRHDRLVAPHPLLWTLGNTPFAREAAYTKMVHEGIAQEQQIALTRATLHGWAWGGERFMAELQEQTPRRASPLRPGRPPRQAGQTGE